MKKDILVKIVLAVAVAALLFSAGKLGVRAYQDKAKTEKDEEIASLYPSGKSAQKLGSETADAGQEKETETGPGDLAIKAGADGFVIAERKVVHAKPLASDSKADDAGPGVESEDAMEANDGETAKSEDKHSLLKKNFRSQKKAFEDAAAEEKKNAESSSSGKNDKESAPEYGVIQSDFSALYEKNEHIAGWLIAGENIDYPVVYYDNSFYLDHDFYGNSDANGTLFVNEENTLWPADNVILIHGHNMNNGQMFGKLLNFSSYEYLSQYPLVSFRTIYDEDQYVYYVPVAAFDASMTEGNQAYFDVLQMKFENEQDYQTYLDSLKAWSVWNSPAGVTTDDSLLMLVTCSYDLDDGRFMLVCRKLRDGETTEDIQRLFSAAVNQ